MFEASVYDWGSPKRARERLRLAGGIDGPRPGEHQHCLAVRNWVSRRVEGTVVRGSVLGLLPGKGGAGRMTPGRPQGDGSSEKISNDCLLLVWIYRQLLKFLYRSL